MKKKYTDKKREELKSLSEWLRKREAGNYRYRKGARKCTST